MTAIDLATRRGTWVEPFLVLGLLVAGVLSSVVVVGVHRAARNAPMSQTFSIVANVSPGG